MIDLRGRALAEGGYAIDVEDRGPGVPTAHRDRIFEPFFSERRGGTGLGLAVCMGIVRAHGGSLSVHDGEHGGTRMRITLPASKPSSTPAPAPEAEA